MFSKCPPPQFSKPQMMHHKTKKQWNLSKPITDSLGFTFVIRIDRCLDYTGQINK